MNSYIVLGDDDTFDSAQNVVVCLVSKESEEKLWEAGTFKAMEDGDVADSVSLKDLLALWNKTHGTHF